jgi:hypothetical protein
MAVRTHVYQGLLWQHVIDEQELKAGARLVPLLLLVVLYIGEERWTAATGVRELSALSEDSALWPWQPKQQWFAEGHAKGKAEGKAEAVVCLLAERFGPVAQSWQDRIRGVDLATLEHWFMRAIVAPDLQSVFALPR